MGGQEAESIGLYLDMEPRYLLDHIRVLSKPFDLVDLQARVDYLLRKNGELMTKAKEGKALRKEMKELNNWIAAIKEELKTSRTERDKAKEVARKIHSFLGFSSDVLNKARL